MYSFLVLLSRLNMQDGLRRNTLSQYVQDATVISPKNSSHQNDMEAKIMNTTKMTIHATAAVSITKIIHILTLIKLIKLVE